ncbi:MAG TPA: hypothetical protein VFA43_22220 [Gemmatimonadaceae bacterium]|nr:hypothetical protein [Gemmatimonadaceae bacterium]
MTETPDGVSAPRRTFRDRLLELAEQVVPPAAGAALPVAAGAATAGKAAVTAVAVSLGWQLVQAIFAPRYRERVESWMDEVADALGDLADRIDDLSPEALNENPAFITALAHATQIAGRTHQAEKLALLRDAVLNAAARTEPDEDLQLVFLQAVDQFTPWHVRVLDLFQDPKARGFNSETWTAGSRAHVLEAAFPEIRAHPDFVRLLVRDLYTRGFLSVDSLGGQVSGSGMVQKLTTPLGDRFLRFVSAPPC